MIRAAGYKGKMSAQPLNASVAEVTAIIPCFNAKATLARAVESVVGQSLPVKEIFIVDDGSHDGTVELARELAKRYETEVPIRVIPLPRNGGPSAARNAGWDRATGRYVAFLDDDDSWHPRKIEVQYSYMMHHPELIVASHEFTLVDYDPHLAPEPHEKVSVHRFREVLLKNRHVTPSLMIQRKISDRFPEGRHYMEDHLLLLQLTRRYGSIVQIQKPLCRLYKAQFGAAGLSSHLLPMYWADLTNYWVLRSKGYLGFFNASLFSAYASLKFLRRLAILAWRPR